MIGRYRHYKTKGLYDLLMVATDEATLDAWCVYRSISDNTVWVRPAADFFEAIDVGEAGYPETIRRFEPVALEAWA